MPWFRLCCCGGSDRAAAEEKAVEEGNRTTPLVPLCPSLSQGDTLTSRLYATMPWCRRKATHCLRARALGADGTCWRRLFSKAAGETDVNAQSRGLKSTKLERQTLAERRLQVSGSLISFVYSASDVGLFYLDLLSSLTQILWYVQVNVRSLAQRRQFSLLSRLPHGNDKLEMLNSLVWVLQLKKNFGESYAQRIITTSSLDISPRLRLKFKY